MRSLLILLAGASLASAQGLSAGAAQVTISPPAGTPMAGYYATRLSTGVHDDLHAKAIVIASGGQRVALVACDLVGIPPAVIEEAREIIQRATGIPGRQRHDQRHPQPHRSADPRWRRARRRLRRRSRNRASATAPNCPARSPRASAWPKRSWRRRASPSARAARTPSASTAASS